MKTIFKGEGCMWHKQRGMTLIGWVITLTFAGLVLLFLARLTPLYVQDYTIRSSLQDLQGDPRLHGLDGMRLKNAILDALNKRFRINNVDVVNVNEVEMKRTPEGMLVTLDYMAETKYIANIHLLVKFHHEVVVEPTQ